MSEGHSGGQAESGSIGSSRGSTWRDRTQKRREDREHKRGGEESGLGEGSDQTHRTMFGALGRGQRDAREQELEQLRKLVMDLKLEARGGTREGTETTKQGGEIAWEIRVKRALASPTSDGPRIDHVPENHVDTGTTRTLERCVRTETVHDHVDITTEARIHQRNDEPTMLPWTP